MAIKRSIRQKGRIKFNSFSFVHKLNYIWNTKPDETLSFPFMLGVYGTPYESPVQ